MSQKQLNRRRFTQERSRFGAHEVYDSHQGIWISYLSAIAYSQQSSGCTHESNSSHESAHSSSSYDSGGSDSGSSSSGFGD